MIPSCRRAVRGLVLLVTLSVAAVLGAHSPQPWPPGVQHVADASPPLTPEAAMKTFYLPPGYRLELVASEPLVQDPIWIDVDPDGRLWVVEMLGFMPDRQGTNEHAPVCRIVVLQDTDDDGRMDTSTVFLDHLVLPRSLAVLDHGVLVIEPPHLWLARDTDGDLRADSKELLRDDYGRADGNPEHNANGLLWAMDNRIYSSEHGVQARLRHGQWEFEPTLQRGQWGLTMDDVGRIYRNWNEGPLFVDYVPPLYFMRNPHVVRTRGAYEPIFDDITVWPVRPNPGVNRGYREGTLRKDGSLAIFAAAGTPVAYRGDRLPEELRGNIFVTEPAGNLVRRFVVSEDPGTGDLHARNAYDRGEFVASTDERFRPVNLYSAPDGTLYIVDMYRGIIQHRQYQSEYLQSFIRDHQLGTGIGYGRIYRVVHTSTVRDHRPALSHEPPSTLVHLLEHPNGWWRDTAQRLLVERGEASVAPALRQEATGAPEPRTRLHALWTLDGLDAIEPADVEHALEDASPHVRAAAVRLSERWLAQPGHPLAEQVLRRGDDPSPIVRRQLAASLGALPPEARDAPVLALLEQYGDDPVLVDAAVSGLKDRELDVLDALLARTASGSPRADAVAMLAGAVIKSAAKQPVMSVLGWAAQPDRPAWQRLAILQGVQAVMPSTGEPGADAPATVTLRFAEPPTPLIDLSRGEGDVAARARTLLSSIDWPGKPHQQPEPPPLTPEEQRRYAAGREVFNGLCAACHQPDGRGLAGVAPPLVGSKWALGRPGLAARIVLNGKEGTALMPPLGQTLSDDQIAAALTYVRRSWGQAAPAVDPSLVREVRGASTGRTRPWTEQDLLKVTQPDGPPRVAR